MIVDEIGTEFGVIQLGREVTRRETELALIVRLVIGSAWSARAERGNRGGDRNRSVRHQRMAEAEEHLIGTGRRNIAGAEEGTGSFRLGLVPHELIEGFNAQIVGNTEIGVENRHRGQGVTDLRTGNAEAACLQRVDDVDAVLDKSALTPAQNLITDPEIEWHFILANLIGGGDIGIEQIEAATDAVDRIIAQVTKFGIVLVGIQEVIEIAEADKGTVVFILQVEFVVGTERERDDAGVIVQVAVIAIDRLGTAAV